MDTDRLVKLLGMTGSAHDGEAMVALRMATKLMAASGVTWADLVRGKAQGWTGGRGLSQADLERARLEGFADGKRSGYAEGYRVAQRAYQAEAARQAYQQPSKAEKLFEELKAAWAKPQAQQRATAWERGFVEDVLARGVPYSGYSEKQEAVIEKLMIKFCAA